MIDRYLERRDLFMLDDGVKAICVITDEGNGVCELEKIAVAPESQRQGYGKRLINYLLSHYSGKYDQMIVGIGDVPSTVLRILFFKEKIFRKLYHLSEWGYAVSKLLPLPMMSKKPLPLWV